MHLLTELVADKVRDLGAVDPQAAHRALFHEVRRGVADGEFVLHYQPVCEATGRPRGFEALMRWQHPMRGLLGPVHFAPAFTDPGLAVALGDVALREATKQMGAWHTLGFDFGYVAVNLATAQFGRSNFVSDVVAMLREHHVAPSALALEVRESVYLDGRAEQILWTLRGFRKAGISIALDDFGTGHASLGHLKQFPIDRIKIDQTFVRELGRHAHDTEVVRAIVTLARHLGMEVVAEGVETEAQLALLDELGCERLQGFFFAQPMPAAEVVRFCETFVLEQAGQRDSIGADRNVLGRRASERGHEGHHRHGQDALG